MEKMHFSIDIQAPREKVWKTLWDDASYRNWTRAFLEGSYAVTDNWKEGSKVLFLAADGRGMVSKVAANRTNEYMSFEHLGVVQDGLEDTSSEKVKEWKGALENYTLTQKDGVTTLTIEADITDEYKSYFEKAWPSALELVKQLSENQ
jgi:hypothetical protein